MDSMYKEEIIDHYKNPRNYGTLDDPDIHVDANNPLCGDRLSMDLKIRDGIVESVAFSGRGCAISQASASMLTENVIGKPLTELAGTTRQDGQIVTAGGRVLNVTALGATIGEARARAYDAIDRIHFDGAHYRRDIAARVAERVAG